MSWRFKSIVGTLFVATAIALCVRLFLIENYRITSQSMAPGLNEGDVVLISKFAYNVHLPFSSYEVFRFKLPRLGELAMFTVPDHGLDPFVKRVVATQGDRVQILDGVLQINGKAAEYQPQDAPQSIFNEKLPGGAAYPVKWDRQHIENYGPVDVPNGYFFVLGDNRLDTSDSRTWGPIPLACLKGKVAMVWYSAAPPEAAKSQADNAGASHGR